MCEPDLLDLNNDWEAKIMATETKKTKNVNPEHQQLQDEWQKKAREAARRYNLPLPDKELAPQETEQRLRQAEQEGGE